MKSIFIKEQKRYSVNELLDIFEETEEELSVLLNRLQQHGIVKKVKNDASQVYLSTLNYEDEEINENSRVTTTYLYVFKYVGIVTVNDLILKCYPKYVENSEKNIILKQIIKVLDKYNSREQIIPLINDVEGTITHNILPMMIYLLNDYHIYGSYQNTEVVIEKNGTSDILWDKTINETFTLIHNNRPYYPEVLTKRRLFDDYDYFKRLHECLVTSVSKDLESAGLLEIFEYTPINVSDELLEEFGDVEYILNKIEIELSVQFNTRKQSVLKMIFALLSNRSNYNNSDSISFYGTNNFNLVWEKACQIAFGNIKDVPLANLKLPTKLKDNYNSEDTLQNIIEKPRWVKVINNEKKFEKEASNTLIPDIVTIHEEENLFRFLLLDAKYYIPVFEESSGLTGQPGISDVTKQYVYQMAYMKFISDHNFNEVGNYFIFPTENNEMLFSGYVKLEIFSELALENIEIIEAPAEVIFNCFLHDNKLNIKNYIQK